MIRVVNTLVEARFFLTNPHDWEFWGPSYLRGEFLTIRIGSRSAEPLPINGGSIVYKSGLPGKTDHGELTFTSQKGFFCRIPISQLDLIMGKIVPSLETGKFTYLSLPEKYDSSVKMFRYPLDLLMVRGIDAPEDKGVGPVNGIKLPFNYDGTFIKAASKTLQEIAEALDLPLSYVILGSTTQNTLILDSCNDCWHDPVAIGPFTTMNTPFYEI